MFIRNINKLKNHGFTLVELSIVILIISFIVAGITTGKALYNNAQLQAVIREVNTYNTAVNNFYTKYNFYPGDITTASNFWPSCDATPANCNGNGNGIIEPAVVNGTTRNEIFRAWQQLASSNLIPGNYSGVATTANQPILGKNIPASQYPGGGYSFDTVTSSSATLQVFDFGAFSTSGSSMGFILTPANAYYIDSKIDDGLAGSGLVWATGAGGSTSCFNAGVYLIQLNNILCSMQFQIN
jgi:prepilin-type N-terminal cleavage/methylation domain-containing protein